MDFKKLGKFIMGFGAVVFAVGAIWYLTNLPVERVDNNGNIFENVIAAHDENLGRSAERSSSGWTMAFGAIIAFVGIAIRASCYDAMKAVEVGQQVSVQLDNAPYSTSSLPESVPCPFCSKPLERATWQTYCIHCYQHLPPETRAELASPF